MQNTLQIGDVIAVQRFGYAHVGIYVGSRGFFGRNVVHNNKSKGVVLASTADFSSGQPIHVRKRAAANHLEQEQIAQRALSLLGKKFDLLNFNCEHAANFAQSGRAESPQLQGAFLVALFVGFIMSRN